MASKWRNCLYRFDAPGVTHYGGLTLFLLFCKCIGLKRYVSRQVRWEGGCRRGAAAEMFVAHLLLIVAGIGRVENSHALQYNGALAELMGLEAFPTVRALRAFLARVDERTFGEIQTAHDRLRAWLWRRPPTMYSAVIDLDTTALRVYGRPEGAVKGYVPHYAGQRCYSTRLLTEAQRGLTLAGELRSGHVHGSVEAADFVEAKLALLPGHVARSRIRLRADSAFYAQDFVESLERQGISYAIDARITGPIRRLLGGVRYREFRRGYEAGECRFRPCRWKNDTRLVIVRRQVRLLEPPVTLFTLKDYAYTVQLTNLEMSPEGVWRFYCDRAAQELLIRELKGAYALGKIPTHRFQANRLYVEMLLWAYDLVGWFRRECLPPAWAHSTLATLRRDVWTVPGVLVRSGRRYQMHLPERFEQEAVFRHARKMLARLPTLDDL